MRDAARDIAPRSQPAKNRGTSREPASASGGKHHPMDGVAPSPRERGRPARLSANRLTVIGHMLGPLDCEALQFLAKFTVATTDQLRRALYSDRVSRHAGELAVWRLARRLEHDRLIACLPRRVGGITGGSTPALWHLTSGGRRFANAGGGTTTLKPDAYLLGAARGSAYERLWLLEIDMGSESPATVRRKAAVYEAYRRTGIEQSRNGAFPIVAWIAPDQRRAERLGRLFAASGLKGLHEAMTLDAFVAQAVLNERGDESG